jgi:hypothetical protein
MSTVIDIGTTRPASNKPLHLKRPDDGLLANKSQIIQLKIKVLPYCLDAHIIALLKEGLS